ncbi:MAG: PD40 domain-containing protein, partial [Phycisphaerales bacterium]
GFLRPRLLLPKGMIEALSEQELRYVLLHELAHLKRHDIYIGWLVSLLQILHWFNPLVWLAFYRMRADRELACDALVLARTQSDEPKSYGRIIVSLVERFSRPQRLPGMAGILETKAQLKRRVTMITRFKKNSYQWSPLAVALIIIIGCLSLPDAISTESSGIQDTQPAPHISLRRIWAGSNNDGQVSPDGRYLTYTDWQTGDLAIYEIATGTKRRLTNKGSWDESDECVYSSAWSPDSKHIVYAWEIREQGSGYMELRMVRLDGSEPRILYTDKETEWARVYDWSPDNKQILTCMLGKDGTGRISFISMSDGSERILKAAGKYVDWPRNMSFSPDGNKIVYSYPQEEDSKNHDIFVITIDGGREIPLVEHPAHDFVLGWAPDGKNILFASDRTGAVGMWLTAVEDGKPQGSPRMIKSAGGGFEPLGFTQKSSFYYGTSSENYNVYAATLDPQTGKIIAPLQKAVQRYEGFNMVAAYSPDGKYMAYIYKTGNLSPRHSNNILCIRSLETKKEREFPLNLILRDSNLRSFSWSPDGRYILVSGRNDSDGNGGTFRIDVQTGNITRIKSGRAAVWSHDGKSVLSLSTRQIMIDNIENGNQEVLYSLPSDERIFNMALSPDGKWLALRCFRPTSLKILPVAGGQSRALPEFEKIAHLTKPITWTADSRYVLFLGDEPDSGDHPLCRISIENGKVDKLGFNLHSLLGLSAHPDSRQILVSGSESTPESEVWVMENFLPESTVVKSEPTPTLRQIEVKGRGSVHSKPSFDGKYMSVVVRDRETGTDNLVIRELATGKERTLVKNTDPNWFVHGSHISPDSKKVAFHHYNPDKGDFDLRIIGIDGSNLRTLLGAEIAGYFNIHAWSPDGKYIFGMLMKKPLQLARVSLDDGSMEVLKTFEQGSAARIDASPDGRYLAYSRIEQEGSNPDIFIYDLQQNRETPLVRHSAADKLLGWTPDGQHVFFTSDRNGTWDGWLLRVVDGKPLGLPEIIKAGIGDVSPIGFTQSGAYYYAFNHEAWNVYTAELDRNTGQVVSEPVPVRLVGKDFCPDFSPDGRYLAYLSQPDRKKPQVIRIRTLTTGQEWELKIDLPRFERLRWCPDSRHLLITFFRYMGPPSIIYTVDIQTGEYTALAQIEDRHIRQAELSADGKTLIYRKLGLGTVTPLIIRDMETGSERELQFAGTSLAFWSLSPDGKEVAFSIREVASPYVLKIFSLETDESRTLVEDVGYFPVWSSDGRDVFFTRRVNELWCVSATGSEPRKLLEWKEMIMAPRIHPDGQRIAFHSGGYVSEMWVMENFLPTRVASAVR